MGGRTIFCSRLRAYRRTIFLSVPVALLIDASAACSCGKTSLVVERASPESLAWAYRISAVLNLLPLPPEVGQDIRTLFFSLERDPLTVLQPPRSILQQCRSRQQPSPIARAVGVISGGRTDRSTAHTSQEIGSRELGVKLFRELLEAGQVGLGRFNPGLVLGFDRLGHALEFDFHLGDLENGLFRVRMSSGIYVGEVRTISSASSNSISTLLNAVLRCSTPQ